MKISNPTYRPSGAFQAPKYSISQTCEGLFLFVCFFSWIKTRRQVIFSLPLFAFHWGVALTLSCPSAAHSAIFSPPDFSLPAEGELSGLQRPPHRRQTSPREDFLLAEKVNVNRSGKSFQMKITGRCWSRARGPSLSSRICFVIRGRGKCLKHFLRPGNEVCKQLEPHCAVNLFSLKEKAEKSLLWPALSGSY